MARRPNLETGKDEEPRRSSQEEPHCGPEFSRCCTREGPTGKGVPARPPASDELRAMPIARKANRKLIPAQEHPHLAQAFMARRPVEVPAAPQCKVGVGAASQTSLPSTPPPARGTRWGDAGRRGQGTAARQPPPHLICPLPPPVPVPLEAGLPRHLHTLPSQRGAGWYCKVTAQGF